ncbi:MAG: TraR/DksA C4-type zinc finger protein [Candidatus Sedimenticola sp. 6PFRAG7]
MDPVDKAKEAEVRFRNQSLKRQQDHARETETPHVEDGIHYCIDCGDEIPEERMDARPESVRCVPCKQQKEQRERLYR